MWTLLGAHVDDAEIRFDAIVVFRSEGEEDSGREWGREASDDSMMVDGLSTLER